VSSGAAAGATPRETCARPSATGPAPSTAATTWASVVHVQEDGGKSIMPWLYLGVAIVAEIIATSVLKASEGFTRLIPSLIVLIGYVTTFYFLSLTLRTMPLGSDDISMETTCLDAKPGARLPPGASTR
jgi:hypothetical protein